MLTPKQRAVLTEREKLYVGKRFGPRISWAELADSRIESKQLRERLEAALKAAELYRKATHLDTLGQNTHKTSVICECRVCGQQVYIPKDEYRTHGPANYQSQHTEAESLLAFARAESQPTAAEIDEYNRTKPWK